MVKQTNQKVLLSCLFLMALFSLSFVLGANEPNVVAPLDNANFTSTLLNCTYVNATGGVTDPVSANSSFYQNGVAIPCTLTITSSYISCTPTASQFTDGLAQNITCKIGNATDTAWSLDNATNVNIYTSTPTCAFSTDIDSVKYQDAVGILTTQSSTKDALFSLTYAWTLYRSDGTVVTTKTTSAPSFLGSDFDQIGDSTLALVVTDTVGNTASCSNKTITVSSSDGTTTTTTTTQQVANDKKSTTMIVLFVLIFLIVIAGISYLLIGVKK